MRHRNFCDSAIFELAFNLIALFGFLVHSDPHFIHCFTLWHLSDDGLAGELTPTLITPPLDRMVIVRVSAIILFWYVNS